MAVDLVAWWADVPEGVRDDLLARYRDKILPVHLVRLLTQAGFGVVYGSGFNGSPSGQATFLGDDLMAFLDARAAEAE